MAAAAVAAAGVAVVAADPKVVSSNSEPDIERSELTSGVRVITERMPEARSVSIGMWFAVGSRDEPAQIAGASHFLEHLLFKGTEERSARSIALAIDAVGGEMNAYTTREHTAYYLRLPVAELHNGLELLADVVSAPAFREHELDAERDVIIEELLMSEDTPDDLVITALYESLYPDHPLGRETLGSHDTVEAMARADVAAFHAQWYRPRTAVVAAAGALDHHQVLDAIAGLFDGADPGAAPERSAPDAPIRPLVVIDRPIEQVHVAIGWPALSLGDDDRYAMWVANHVLGGGMSSRLFQQIREERGLAYTVFTSPSSYSDAGSLIMYAGTAVNRLGELLDVTDEEVAEGITAEEHRVALGYLEGSMLLGLEDSGSRMSRLGTGIATRDDITPVDEHIRRIRAVTIEDVTAVIGRIFGGPRAVSAVGPLGSGNPALDRFVQG
ncbi:MAG: insulinase family protein [Actinobacteria bacterium]|nr:insulinase family protein [Actinomycetota bacterium]